MSGRCSIPSFDSDEFERELRKYGPVEAAFTVWQYARAAQQATSAPQAITELVAPIFWYRPIGNDGLYEGPIHNNSVEGKSLRDEKPGEWVPLYRDAHQAGAQPVAQADQDALDAKRWRFMMAVADDPNSEEGKAMEDASTWSTQTYGDIDTDKRAGSVVVTEIADKALVFLAATPVTDQPKQGGAK